MLYWHEIIFTAVCCWKIRRPTGDLINNIGVSVKPDSFMKNGRQHDNTTYGEENDWYLQYKVCTLSLTG